MTAPSHAEIGPPPPKPRTNLYVDGFNLYHRIVRDTPYKWLNVTRLAGTIVKNADIHRTRSFTARTSARPNDPFIAARQDVYFRALRTIPRLTIHEGSFQQHPHMTPLHPRPMAGPKYAQVLRTEEKGSDVILASYLLFDAFNGEYEQAIVITNASDLCTPIRLVVAEMGLPVIVLGPSNRLSKELRGVATAQLSIREGPLSACQFPRQVVASNGRTITKPDNW